MLGDGADAEQRTDRVAVAHVDAPSDDALDRACRVAALALGGGSVGVAVGTDVPGVVVLAGAHGLAWPTSDRTATEAQLVQAFGPNLCRTPLGDPDGARLGELWIGGIAAPPPDQLADVAAVVAASLRWRMADAEARAALQAAERTIRRLDLSSSASTRLASALRPDDALARLLGLAVPDLAAWAVVFLEPSDDSPAQVVARHADARRDLALTSAFDVGGRAGRHLRPLWEGQAQRLVLDPPEALDPNRVAIAAAVAEFGGHRALVAPIVADGRVLGGLLLAGTEGMATADDDAVAMVEDLGRRAGVALANARQFTRDREIATTLQHGLLPTLPDVPGVELHGEHWPAVHSASVGGDWYDALVLPDGTLGLVVGDVSGHDVAAAAIMGRLRGALRSYAWEGHGPAEVLERLDASADGLLDGRFATCLYLRCTPPASPGDVWTVTWSSAGHLPAVVRRPDGSTELWDEHTGPLIGAGRARRPLPHRQVVTTLAPGALVALTTDGLVERRGESIDDGLARLVAALAKVEPGEAVAPASRRVFAAVEPDGQDDVALLLARFGSAPPAAPLERG